MFATFLQKSNEFPGLPDSLFALNDPVLTAIPMQLEAKHNGFLRDLKYVVNKFLCRSAAYSGQENCLFQTGY
ncbi:MAG: hypothetical protein JNL16_09150 [Dechloromonas sp.]|nr:hypothetical protein [Dechloromonas sp.]